MWVLLGGLFVKSVFAKPVWSGEDIAIDEAQALACAIRDKEKADLGNQYLTSGKKLYKYWCNRR
jgi:hypothetical protein